MNQNFLHFGILLSNVVDKNSFIEKLLSDDKPEQLRPLKGCKGILFSDLTIAEIVENEHRHQHIEISTSQNRQLQTFSSGERRKVLLEYCLSQQPDFIIFDNPFDHLDHISRMELSEQMRNLAVGLSIIQLAHREDSLLPFIDKRGYVYDNSFVIHDLPQKTKNLKSNAVIEIPDTLLSFDKAYQKIVKFDKVNINYDDQPILQNISWEVKSGEFWQLIGPNGSGKSTILSLITGENPKAYGQNIVIFDRKKGSGESVWEIKKKIGHFSTNMTELFKRNQSVEHMILSGFFDSIGLYQKPSGLQLRKAEQWLDVVGMGHLKNQSFRTLSLGQQRLVLIVRALIKQPPLLILDEPFEGLDDDSAKMVANLLNILVKTTSITLLYVSHTLEKTLVPSHVFELKPSSIGSIGQVRDS